MAHFEDRADIPDLPSGVVPGFGKPIMGRRMERFITKPTKSGNVSPGEWVIVVPKECLDNIEWVEPNTVKLKELIEVTIMKVPTTGFS